jgi:hypothetical protein
MGPRITSEPARGKAPAGQAIDFIRPALSPRQDCLAAAAKSRENGTAIVK